MKLFDLTLSDGTHWFSLSDSIGLALIETSQVMTRGYIKEWKEVVCKEDLVHNP